MGRLLKETMDYHNGDSFSALLTIHKHSGVARDCVMPGPTRQWGRTLNACYRVVFLNRLLLCSTNLTITWYLHLGHLVNISNGNVKLMKIELTRFNISRVPSYLKFTTKI